MEKYFSAMLISLLFCVSFVAEAQHDILYFKVSHRIVTDDSATAPIQDVQYIPLVMELLNKYFAPAKMQL